MNDQEIMDTLWQKGFGNKLQEKLDAARIHPAYKNYPSDEWRKLKFAGRSISGTGRVTLKFKRDNLPTVIKFSLSHSMVSKGDLGYLVYETISEWMSQDPMFKTEGDKYSMFYGTNFTRPSFEAVNALGVLFLENGFIELMNQVTGSIHDSKDAIRAKKAKYKGVQYGRKITAMVDELFEYGVELEEVVELVRMAYIKKVSNV